MFSVLHTGGSPTNGYTLLQSGGMYFRAMESAGQPRSILARNCSSHSLPVAGVVARPSFSDSIRSIPTFCERLIDLARFFVILDPAQEHRAYRHAGLGADRPEILPVDAPRAYPDEDLPVVKDRPPISRRCDGSSCRR